MKDDEIVRQVRRARAKIFRECGGTLEGLFAHLKKWEREHPERIVSLHVRRSRRSS